MVVHSHEDMILLRGTLIKNEWLTVKALARLLLQQYRQGILIDCSALTEVSEQGSKTFLDAMRDIQKEGARIIMVNLPDSVYEVVKTVPGVRSQLPIAKSVEEARLSLRTGGTGASESNRKLSHKTILVPLIPGCDIAYAIRMAGRIGRDLNRTVTTAAILVVARNLPIGAPMSELESQSNELLEEADAAAKINKIVPVRHSERVRDADEGLLQLIKSTSATHVIVAIYPDRITDEKTTSLIDMLMRRAPCNVVIGREEPTQQHPLLG